VSLSLPQSAPWPPWAPLGEEEIAQVLTLANLGRDERFVDLGCGDGRVLDAALEAGALATGIEVRGELARAAQRRLARWGARARVLQQSFHTAELDADVVFVYLSPAALQRLSGRLACLPSGTRIITAWFPLPDWEASLELGNCQLYRLPVEKHPPLASTVGSWASPAILCFLPPRGGFLVTATIRHPPGPVRVVASASVEELAELSLGADNVHSPTRVAVDLVFEPRSLGTKLSGTLSSPIAGECQLLCLYHSDGWGYWPVDAALIRRVLTRLDFAASVSLESADARDRLCGD